jgi:hypothetical protein
MSPVINRLFFLGKPLSVKEKMESDLLIGTTEDLGKILDRQVRDFTFF